MGFEFLYAYLENISIVCWIGFWILSFMIVFFIYLRIENEMDKDDWVYAMAWVTPIWLFSLILCCAPGKEHIKDVKLEMDELYKVETPKPSYPNSYCTSSVTCGSIIF